VQPANGLGPEANVNGATVKIPALAPAAIADAPTTVASASKTFLARLIKHLPLALPRHAASAYELMPATFPPPWVEVKYRPGHALSAPSSIPTALLPVADEFVRRRAKKRGVKAGATGLEPATSGVTGVM